MRPHHPEVMSAQEADIARRLLHHHRRHIYEAVISSSGLPEWKFSTLRIDRPSSLGKFDDLPLELLHECMVHMDLLSLLRLSRVSRRGMAVVMALRQLKPWITAVDTIPAILAKAHILDLHSLSTLNAALHSEQCVSCGAYGTFLHLLSASRCCFTCLRVNQSLWVMSLPEAKKCFGLDDHHLKSLPVMWSIPGIYGAPQRIKHKHSRRLTSVHAAKALALRLHGSLEALERVHPVEEDFEMALMKWYRQAPMKPLAQDPLGIDHGRNRPKDVRFGMAVIHFPSLASGQVEWGHACLECDTAYVKFVCDEMEPDLLARLVPQGCDPLIYMSRVGDRLWSATGLVRHAKACHCA